MKELKPRLVKPSFTIKCLRERFGLTQFDLAKASGVSLSTIVKIEGDALIPTIKTCAKIASAMGVGLDIVARLALPQATQEGAEPYSFPLNETIKL